MKSLDRVRGHQIIFRFILKRNLKKREIKKVDEFLSNISIYFILTRHRGEKKMRCRGWRESFSRYSLGH